MRHPILPQLHAENDEAIKLKFNSIKIFVLSVSNQWINRILRPIRCSIRSIVRNTIANVIALWTVSTKYKLKYGYFESNWIGILCYIRFILTPQPFVHVIFLQSGSTMKPIPQSGWGHSIPPDFNTYSSVANRWYRSYCSFVSNLKWCISVMNEFSQPAGHGSVYPISSCEINWRSIKRDKQYRRKQSKHVTCPKSHGKTKMGSHTSVQDRHGICFMLRLIKFSGTL